ncbi:MuDRA-like transposase [Cucumis melo var. makuwa]|uniref:MuDRA-like transposase n=1 Tax=Cucumis melo var. makuwa TaxID=1194695 RepID=A0A5D3CFW2_CUCMM|nr:MuDRA-like transposase [Cucumis melo var. makuwa]TYK10857.1 MuDRA-like transposase [Cucumis melo var. makuwa]
MAQKNIKLSSLEPNLQLIPEYNVVLNEVRNLSSLTVNVCPLELGDDTNRLVSMVHVKSFDDDFNDNDNSFGMEISSEIMMLRRLRPNEIIQDFRKEYKVDITYVRAWRAREAALSMVGGSFKESYTLLAQYEEALKISKP